MQIDALEQAGRSRIFQDHASGTLTTRLGLLEAFTYLRPDDILVVWRLDRLGRSLKHLIELIATLEVRGLAFKVYRSRWIPPPAADGWSFISLRRWLNLSAT